MMTYILIAIAVVVLVNGAIRKPAPGRSGEPIEVPSGAMDAENNSRRLRLATYNIYGGKGVDGIRDLRRTAGVLDGMDIVALQEVNGWYSNNQARDLGTQLKLASLFAPSRRRWYHGDRGNALLTKFPIARWHTFRLLPFKGRGRFRNYTVAEVRLGDKTLSILFTHLHTGNGREQQLRTVLQRFQRLPSPAALIGDLNTQPTDPLLAEYMPQGCVDGIGSALKVRDERGRVDWILCKGLEITDGGVTEIGASDHPFYWVEVGV